MKVKYNTVKRIFNLLSAIFGILIAVFFIFTAIVIIGYGVTEISDKHRIWDAILPILLSLSAIILDIYFLIYSSRLCKKQKDNKDGTFEKRTRLEVRYIVFLFLSLLVTFVSYFAGVAMIKISNNDSIADFFIILVIIAVILLSFHITYMAIPAAKEIKEKTATAQTQKIKIRNLNMPDDATQRFYNIIQDLKLLYEEKTINNEQFVLAFDTLVDGFIAVTVEA